MPEHEAILSPPPPLPRELVQRAYFFGQLLDSGARPADPTWADQMANAEEIVHNHYVQYPEGSEFREVFAKHLKPNHIDPFTVSETAVRLADLLFEGTEQPDMFDLMLAVRTWGILSAETTVEAVAGDSQRIQRAGVLGRAFFDAAIMRIAPQTLVGEELLNLPSLYEHTFKDRDHQSTQQLLAKSFLEAQLKIRDNLILNDMILEAKLFSPYIPNKTLYKPHLYNIPLTPEDKDAINKEAAETIERLHLLKAYRVAPIIVSAETVELPWEILIMPPLDKSLQAYEEGGIADFYFTHPKPERVDAKLNLIPTDHSQLTRLELGENETLMMRFRLHDNGQISFGLLYESVPSDFAEQIFAQSFSHDAFVRLRGLFIALAFDALAPGEVVERNVGGSVASALPRAARRQSDQDPIQKLLLPRRRELRRQKVTPANRQPRDWELPKKDVDGYRRSLPEGTRARADAEKEAREFYESINVKFDGLQPGENFVKGYARGTGPERVTFRRASFRDSTKTRLFLGNTGMGR